MKEVTFEPADGLNKEHTDAAYPRKYRSSPYLGSVIGACARSATVRIMPREPNA